MSLGRLLAVGKCVDGKKPAGGNPFPSGELEFLELDPRLFREKRKLRLQQWLRKGFLVLLGKKERKIDGFYEKQ